MPEPVVGVVNVETFLDKTLGADIISAQRQDHMVGRQGVMNHQVVCHLMDLSFITQQTELSIPESMAIQSMIPREAQFSNLANQTPMGRTP